MSDIPVQIFDTVSTLAEDAESVIKVMADVKAIMSGSNNEMLKKKIYELSGQIAVMRAHVWAVKTLCGTAKMCGYIQPEPSPQSEPEPDEYQMSWLPGSPKRALSGKDLAAGERDDD